MKARREYWQEPRAMAQQTLVCAHSLPDIRLARKVFWQMKSGLDHFNCHLKVAKPALCNKVFYCKLKRSGDFLFLCQPGHERRMSEEKIIALFDALKQIHATALELLDSPLARASERESLSDPGGRRNCAQRAE